MLVVRQADRKDSSRSGRAQRDRLAVMRAFIFDRHRSEAHPPPARHERRALRPLGRARGRAAHL